MKALLNEKEVAQRLGVSVHGVRRWRYEGRGPRALKLTSSLVRYDARDLDTFLSSVPTRGGEWSTSARSTDAPNGKSKE